jgi:hypothetical protein
MRAWDRGVLETARRSHTGGRPARGLGRGAISSRSRPPTVTPIASGLGNCSPPFQDQIDATQGRSRPSIRHRPDGQDSVHGAVHVMRQTASLPRDRRRASTRACRPRAPAAGSNRRGAVCVYWLGKEWADSWAPAGCGSVGVGDLLPAAGSKSPTAPGCMWETAAQGSNRPTPPSRRSKTAAQGSNPPTPFAQSTTCRPRPTSLTLSLAKNRPAPGRSRHGRRACSRACRAAGVLSSRPGAGLWV